MSFMGLAHNFLCITRPLWDTPPLPFQRHIDNRGFFPTDMRRTCRQYNMTRMPPGRRVFDLISFNDELDLLEIRLNELNSTVNVFVVVEGRLSFTGAPKPLVFEMVKNQPRFKRFRHKIYHHIHEHNPSSKPKTEDDFFKIERSKHGTYMLDIFRKAGLQKGDIFLISARLLFASLSPKPW
eukprot:EG_transcript_5381